ncbi:antitoxin VbhA family protein [Pseudonocardia sp. NPDC049635]|uniref:antitoxin VbhA family protein n=1 Tax=Pseudonocardia sp. NPDC049635 TaxID=3155506 RepID=UPI00340AA2D0
MTSSTTPTVQAPSWADAVRFATGSMAADGLEIDDEGMALLGAVAREELTVDDAVEQVLARHR